LCIVFALLNGAVCGTFWTTIAPVTAEIVGLVQLPAALSIVWLSSVLPQTFSEAIALALRRPELTQPGAAYVWPQVFAGLMYIVAGAIMCVLRGRMVGDILEKEKEAGAQREKEGGTVM